jgi:hypothetical protein
MRRMPLNAHGVAMPIRTKFLLLGAILLIAVFFRFYHLTTIPPGLYMDEAMDGVNAQYAAQTGQFQVFYPEDNGREGLYVNLLAFAFRFHLLPDTAPWSVRVPAEVAGTLTVLGVYLLVCVLFKNSREVESPTLYDSAPTLALLSAFFLATSFWHINFSRIGFRAILGPLCLTWATYFLLMAIRSRSSRLSALGPAAIAGIFYGLGFYTYIAFRVTPLLPLLFIPFFRKTRGFGKCFILFVFVTILVALPINWYYLKHQADFIAHTAELSVTNAENPLAVLANNTVKTALMFVWHGDYSWRHNMGGAPELWRPVGILFFLGLVLGIWALVKVDSPFAHRPPRFAILFLLTWLILGSLPAIFSKGPLPHALRALLMVVPAVVFAALGGEWLYQLGARKLNRQSMAIITALFITAAAGKCYTQYFVAWAEHPSVRVDFNADSVDIGNRINALPASEPKYVVVYAKGVIDYGLPMPVEPVLYITHSFVPDAAAQKVVNNIHYLLPSEINQIPPGTPGSRIFEIR